MEKYACKLCKIHDRAKVVRYALAVTVITIKLIRKAALAGTGLATVPIAPLPYLITATGEFHGNELSGRPVLRNRNGR
jgi:hypothetical protein